MKHQRFVSVYVNMHGKQTNIWIHLRKPMSLELFLTQNFFPLVFAEMQTRK